MTEEYLTHDNRQFVEEVMQDRFLSQSLLESPLSQNYQNQAAQWNPSVRRVGLIARKIGNYPLWNNDGKKMLTTLLQV